MTLAIGVLVFDGVEELDFAGPWEVFGMANEVAAERRMATPFDLKLVGAKSGPVICARGLRILPDVTFRQCSHFDILLIPGGDGTRRAALNRPLMDWIATIAAKAKWVTSVCTGTLLLCSAGVARGRKVTTHRSFVEFLRVVGEDAEVVENVRYVRDGNMVTAAGVSAGIDMALWLIGTIHSPDFSRAVQRSMEYQPVPPFSR
jgi:transcriptional regulator GlxA family with amidase domain